MSKTSYSTIAVKYVGSAPALAALDALRALRGEDSVTLDDAAVVTRSTGGEMNYYPIRPVSTRQRILGLAAGGLLFGLVLSRRAGWALLAAALGAAGGWFSTLLLRQRVASAAPFIEKNESVLYMRIRSADWSEFVVKMRPHLVQGLSVIREIAPGHSALRELFAGATDLQTPPREEFPEPPTTGGLVPVGDEDVEPSTVDAEPAQRAPAAPEPAQRQAASVEEADAEADDLTQITGIGPVYGRRLNEGGVSTFLQLAALSVEEVSELADAAAARVRSEDWIGQAAALVQGA